MMQSTSSISSSSCFASSSSSSSSSHHRRCQRFRCFVFGLFGWLTIFIVNTHRHMIFLVDNNDNDNNSNSIPAAATTTTFPSTSSSTSNNNNQQEQQQQRSLLLPQTTTTKANNLNVNLPIIVVGLPKTGTSSIYNFFVKAGYNSSHYKCGRYYCGLCIQSAINSGKAPLKSCGNYDVWAQMDIENIGQCYLPQIEYLDDIYDEYPNATWILSKRSNATKWVDSSLNWIGASGRCLAARLVKCKITRRKKKKDKKKKGDNIQNNNKKIGPKSTMKSDLIEWYETHLQRIRNFTFHHPSLTLVEIDIENPNAGLILSKTFGGNTKPEYWGHENDSINSKASVMKSK